MTFDPHRNFGYSSVAVAPTPAASGTSLTLATGDGGLFPAPGTDGDFNLTVWPAGTSPLASNAEIVRCTGRSGDVLTLARTQEGSTARSIVAGDQIAATITAKAFTDIESVIDTVPGLPGADGWVDDAAKTWTYASSTTFTVLGDETAKYTVGTLIKLVQSSTTKFFVVSAAPAYDGTNTTVTITGGSAYTLANAAISSNHHSYMANPQGYPGWFAYTPAFSGFSANPSDVSCAFAVIGRTCHVLLRAIAGSTNASSPTITLPIAAAAPSDSVTTLIRTINSGSWNVGVCTFTAGSKTLTLFKDIGASGFSNASSSGMIAELFYKI